MDLADAGRGRGTIALAARLEVIAIDLITRRLALSFPKSQHRQNSNTPIPQGVSSYVKSWGFAVQKVDWMNNVRFPLVCCRAEENLPRLAPNWPQQAFVDLLASAPWLETWQAHSLWDLAKAALGLLLS